MTIRQVDGPVPTPAIPGRAAVLGGGPSWLADQLPAVMAEDPLLRRFVLMLETIADSVRDRIDGLEHLVDPGTTPEELLGWLGAWVGVAGLDTTVPTGRQRDTIRVAAVANRARGTAAGVRTHLGALTGGAVGVRDDGGVWRAGAGRRTTGKVVVDVATLGGLGPATVLAQLADHVPAGVRVELRVRGRKVTT